VQQIESNKTKKNLKLKTTVISLYICDKTKAEAIPKPTLLGEIALTFLCG